MTLANQPSDDSPQGNRVRPRFITDALAEGKEREWWSAYSWKIWRLVRPGPVLLAPSQKRMLCSLLGMTGDYDPLHTDHSLLLRVIMANR